MYEHPTSLTADCNHSKLKRLATEFRLAIEKCEGIRTLIATFREFPHGSCGEASLLLAKYLEENGCGSFDYVLGNREGRSHAWLEQGNVIVDITADQFDDNHEPIVVTVDHSWHSSFCGTVQNVADIEIYDLNFRNLARAAYELILTTHANLS